MTPPERAPLTMAALVTFLLVSARVYQQFHEPQTYPKRTFRFTEAIKWRFMPCTEA
jgi:hypothetical protein